jgi:hypothetical protein
MYTNRDRAFVSSLDLMAPEIHDFSELRGLQILPNHMLRRMAAIAAILFIGHVLNHPAESATRTVTGAADTTPFMIIG